MSLNAIGLTRKVPELEGDEELFVNDDAGGNFLEGSSDLALVYPGQVKVAVAVSDSNFYLDNGIREGVGDKEGYCVLDLDPSRTLPHLPNPRP